MYLLIMLIAAFMTFAGGWANAPFWIIVGMCAWYFETRKEEA